MAAAGISVEEFFAHHGVKGMHWGVHRRAGSTSSNPAGANKRLSNALKKLEARKQYHDSQYKTYAAALKEHNKNGVQSQAMRDAYGHHIDHPVYFQQRHGKSLREAHATLADQLEITAGRHALHSDKLQKKIDKIKAKQNKVSHGLEVDDVEDFLKHLEDEEISEEKISDFLAHFGVKGMHWGVRRDQSRAAGVHARAAIEGLSNDPTKKQARVKVKNAGGLHKISDKQLKEMLNRMDMERRYTQAMKEDADRRREGLKAVGRFLEAAGKILVPVAVAAATTYATGTYRTNAITRRAIEGTATVTGT